MPLQQTFTPNIVRPTTWRAGFHAVAVAVAVLIFAGCGEGAIERAGPTGANTTDGGAGVPPCSPPCAAPSERCVEARCVCADGFHDGGDSACVAEGHCSPGFGLKHGVCRPVAEICAEPPACHQATSWSASGCDYAPLPDGTPCAGPTGDPCASNYACQGGACALGAAACGPIRPIVFVHGVNGGPGDFSVMAARLEADGWPSDWLFFFEADSPAWGCNLDNATAIASLVDRALQSTCQPRVDIVAHSMGTLSSRFFIKNLGGTALVNTYVTLGGQHHGLSSPCWAPDFLSVCVWQELCKDGDFISQLNEGDPTPGDLHWVSMYGTADDVVPNESSHLEGAENVSFPGVEHDGPSGLLEANAVYQEVRRVLQYPCW